MAINEMKTIGEVIRELRTSKKLLIREVAAELQIDSSLLSRIERGDKRPTREQVIQLAGILQADEKELMITYLSDRVVYELRGEKLAREAMQAAEKKIAYALRKKRRRGAG